MRPPPCIKGEMGADEADIQRLVVGTLVSVFVLQRWKGIRTNDSKRSMLLVATAASSICECHAS